MLAFVLGAKDRRNDRIFALTRLQKPVSDDEIALDDSATINKRMPKTSKLFWSGRSQAVRLPKEFRMNGDEVRIRKQDAGVKLDLIASDWEWLDAIAGKFSGDFFAAGRQQPDLASQPELGGAFE